MYVYCLGCQIYCDSVRQCSLQEILYFLLFSVLEYSATRAVARSVGGGTVCGSNKETCQTACQFISSY